MTDQELIQLLNEKPATEFTAEELEAVRSRWTQSAELRQALISHLHLQTQLSGALGNVDLDIDSILKRAHEERRHASGRQPDSWKWAIGLCLMAVISIGGYIWLVQSKEQEDAERIGPIAIAEVANDKEQGFTDSVKGENRPAEPSADVAINVAAGVETTEMPVEPTPAAVPVALPAHPIPVEEPWTKALARDVAPWPANSPKLTRDLVASGHDELSETEARRWFSQVEGEQFNWGQDVYGQHQRRAAAFQGLGRLRAPWPETALLRLTPFEVSDLTIYVWRGLTGIALRFYTRRDPHVWAAFEIVRESTSPKPLRWGLLTTDNGSYNRAGLGTVDLRYQDGGITLAKGGVPLMTAPLAGIPDEVFFEGQFRLRGISIHKSAPLISISENPHPILLGGPASVLPWVASAETPAEILTNPDGSATFRVDSRDKFGTMILPLPQRGLYEVIAKVDAADPGTGLFLGDLDGRPLHRLGFFKDSSTGRTTIGVLRPGENRDQWNFDINAFAPPYHTPAQWIKVVAGLGTVQVLVSGDGRHWGHLVENPWRDLPGAVGSIGLFGTPGPAARSLKLAHLEVRELSGISTLVDHRLRSLAPQFSAEELKDPARWTHRVFDSSPPAAGLSNWFLACAVSALSQGPPREFATDLLKRLTMVAINSDFPVSQKLLILDEAGVLCDVWDEGAVRPFAELYEVLGEQLSAAGDPHPLKTVRPAVLRSSFWTASKLRFTWERLNSRELLRTVYHRDWPDAWNLAQSTIFWNLDPHPHKVLAERADLLTRQSRWVKLIAIENDPHLDDGISGVLPVGWRHPLALQWNKEAYNVRAELQSALAGQTYEDACRIVTSINVHDGPGLLPDPDDRQLFVSLPTAVAGAMHAHPQFATLMSEKFGPLGTIRVRQAIQTGDVRSVQSATLQFLGTDAAVEAHQWLGDRDLSAGSFPSAEEHYLLALNHAPMRHHEALQSRLQLASALNGKPLPTARSPLTHPIELNGRTIAPADMESLITALSARPSRVKRFHHGSAVPAPALLPAAFKVEPRALFDGQPGLNPGRHEYRFGDPFGRQLAVAADDRRMYISNRFQVNAYEHTGGGQQWAAGLGSEQGEAHAMPFTPMSPLIAGDRLFVRRISKAGVELACLNADNGQIVWTQRPNLHVLSDPVFWNGSLFALTLARIDEDLVQLEATRFDFETGAPTSSQPLLRLRDWSDRATAAQLTVSGRLAVCSLGGLTACFNGSGEIQWLRRHIWVPKDLDEWNDDFRVAAPSVQGNRVILSVPGVRMIGCVELETGREIWERAIPDLKGVLAVQGQKVLVETAAGMAALRMDDGSVAWSTSVGTRLEAFHAQERTVVLARRGATVNNVNRPYLTWLDLESGRELAQSHVLGADRNECQLGPMFYAGGKWWGMLGQTWKETKRDLVVFTPTAAPQTPGPFARSFWGTWIADVPETQLADLALVLPGWRPEVNYAAARLQLAQGDVRGESPVISMNVAPPHEVRLVQMVTLHAGRKSSLQLRFGNPPDRKWQLAVRINGRQIHEQLVEEAGSANGWHNVTVDLTPFAGQTVPIQIVHSVPPQLPAADVYWKQATILSE